MLRKRDKLINLIENSDEPVKTFGEFLKQTEEISKKTSARYGIPLLKINSSRNKPAFLANKILNKIKI